MLGRAGEGLKSCEKFSLTNKDLRWWDARKRMKERQGPDHELARKSLKDFKQELRWDLASPLWLVENWSKKNKSSLQTLSLQSLLPWQTTRVQLKRVWEFSPREEESNSAWHPEPLSPTAVPSSPWGLAWLTFLSSLFPLKSPTHPKTKISLSRKV